MKFNLNSIYSMYEKFGYTIFDFICDEKVEQNNIYDYDYTNRFGTCLSFAFADCVNAIYNKQVFKGWKTNYDKKLYENLNWYYNCNCKHTNKTLSTLIDEKFTGIVCICCHGGKHAIYMNNGLILNNWKKRTFSTLDEFKQELHYRKSPKVDDYLSYSRVSTMYMSGHLNKYFERIC